MTQGKNIPIVTIKELMDQSSSACLPILVDIQHPSIVWADGDDQENGHLRLINDSVAIKYKGDDTEAKTYYPASFEFTLPSEDGKTVGNTKVTISAIDQRVIKIIRSIDSKAKARFVAFFAKQESNYYFQKLYNYEFEMQGVDWNGITANWNLVFDPVMKLNVPRDLGTSRRFPSVNENN